MLENQLNQVLKILNISRDDSDKVEILTILFDMVESAICIKIGERVVPSMLNWLTNEVVVKRYQLIGAEHLQSEGIDVISSTFKSGDLLEEYQDYLDDYISNFQAEESEDGKRKSRNVLRML